MPTVVNYEPPSGADWQALVHKPEIGTALERTAGRGLVFAQSISQEFRRTGEYSGSFDIDRTTTTVVRGEPRPAVNLANTSDHATLVELKHHVLARTRDFLIASP